MGSMLMLGLPRTRSNVAGGYTLLEILFVLLLIGLVGSLVVPRVDRLYDSVALGGEREDILNAIRSLPAYTRNHGVALQLDSEQAGALIFREVSGDWSIATEEQPRVLANGFCTGGILTLSHVSGRSWTYSLDAPYCIPREYKDA